VKTENLPKNTRTKKSEKQLDLVIDRNQRRQWTNKIAKEPSSAIGQQESRHDIDSISIFSSDTTDDGVTP
jgi:hypothetical protein